MTGGAHGDDAAEVLVPPWVHPNYGSLTFIRCNQGLTIVVGEGIHGGGGGIRVGWWRAAVASEVASAGRGGVRLSWKCRQHVAT